MRVLLGSGGFRTPARIRLLRAEMRRHFGDVRRLLFVPYALADHDRYVKTLYERGLDGEYELDGIHHHRDAVRAVQEAEAVYVGGGNTFRLLAELYDRKLIIPIRKRVRAGLPYLGISAGANMACPTMQTTNDMPITRPRSFRALSLVPFQINPHYFTGSSHVKAGTQFVEHFGETRDDRIREFHEMNDTPVVGLWEAGLLRWDGKQAELVGTPARLFQKGETPVDYPPGTVFRPQRKARRIILKASEPGT